MRPTKLAGIVIVMCLSGCTVWRVQQTVPEAAPELRVTLENGRQMVLQDTRRVGDSLVGVSRSNREELRLALSHVRRIELSQADYLGTFILLGVFVGAVVLGQKVGRQG